MTTGTLYGVGVGPGAPDLLTLRAAALIQSADVIAYPAPEAGVSFAESIVADMIPEAVTRFEIRMPLTVARFPAQEVYDQAAMEIAEHLQAGRTVVVLCEGDPFVYGSFMYLYGRLQAAFPVEVVPGITSLTAGAAALGQPLAARNDVLTVLPAPLPDDRLRPLLEATDAAVIIKLGRHWPRIRTLLETLGVLEGAHFVSHATLPHQQVMPAADAHDDVPYFSLLMVHKRGQAWTL